MAVKKSLTLTLDQKMIDILECVRFEEGKNSKNDVVKKFLEDALRDYIGERTRPGKINLRLNWNLIEKEFNEIVNQKEKPKPKKVPKEVEKFLKKEPDIVEVKFIKKGGELSKGTYNYLSEIPLKPGDKVFIDTQFGRSFAEVTKINIKEEDVNIDVGELLTIKEGDLDYGDNW